MTAQETLWQRFAQRQTRRSAFMSKAAASVASCFDKDGEWIADATSPDDAGLHKGRERLWSGLALYGGNEGQRFLADRVQLTEITDLAGEVAGDAAESNRLGISVIDGDSTHAATPCTESVPEGIDRVT